MTVVIEAYTQEEAVKAAYNAGLRVRTADEGGRYGGPSTGLKNYQGNVFVGLVHYQDKARAEYAREAQDAARELFRGDLVE
jgi:hypothetical protein